MSVCQDYSKLAKPFPIGVHDPLGHSAERHHQTLRWLESEGLITIVAMDDEVAWLVSHKQSFARLMDIPYVERAAS